MRVFLFVIAIAGIGVAGAFFFWPGGDATGAPAEQQAPAPPPEPIVSEEAHEIADGDTFTSAMESLGFSYAQALEILDAAAETYDFASIKAGKDLRVISVDGRRERLEYDRDSETMVIVELGDLDVREKPIEYEIREKTARGTVEESLWLSALDAGMSEAAVIGLAEVFAWSVDFAVQTQEGDAFKVVYEERFRDGEFVGIGDVVTAEYVNAGEAFRAHRFASEDGSVAYYDANGDNLQRAFLKAPLKYNRITSGFTYARFHPTLKRTTPHRAIDYAAPMGTPIRAVGDGTVRFAGWSGGYGRFIKLHHNDVYDTHYAHLSRIAVRAGERVKQGEVIGYVGSSGFSTGPHLHYEIAKYGTLVNPLEVELPPGDPVPEDEREAFERARDAQAAQLDAM